MKKTKNSNLLNWIKSFRLRTLPLALSCTFLGSSLAYHTDTFNTWIFFWAVVTTLFLQILSNLANDYGDTVNGVDNENRVGPARATQSGNITKRAMKRMIVIFILLAFISGSILIFLGLSHSQTKHIFIFYTLGIFAIIAALKYTIGKNPYGYVGLGDFFVFLFFGIVGVCGTFYLHTGWFDYTILLPASSLGLLSTAVLNLNNMRDIDNDANSGKITLVVRIGKKAGKIYHFSLITLSIILSLAYTFLRLNSLKQLIFFLIVIPLSIHLWRVAKISKPELFDPELKKLSLLTFTFTLLFSLGIIL